MRKVIGIVKNETTPKVTEDEVMFTLSSSDSHRGGWYGGLFKQGEVWWRKRQNKLADTIVGGVLRTASAMDRYTMPFRWKQRDARP